MMMEMKKKILSRFSMEEGLKGSTDRRCHTVTAQTASTQEALDGVTRHAIDLQKYPGR